MGKYILALDQGTTSSRAIAFDEGGSPVCSHQVEFPQIYPQPGWVEHDPMQIWETQMESARKVIEQCGGIGNFSCIGITNQRETTVVWDRRTGKPIANAIVWQCRRTAQMCEWIKRSGLEGPIRESTGLVVDAYFSGTKIKWMLDNVEGAQEAARAGHLLFGTIDTWLIWNLTGGKVHATDYSNASRTMLYDIHNLRWDEEILAALDIPKQMLPEVLPSSGLFGTADPSVFSKSLPITGAAGDQQASLFGHACFNAGEAKNTYGTGCFILMNTGDTPVASCNNLLTTIAWGCGQGSVEYALEGSVFVGGAAIQWLRDELHMIQKASETEALATSVHDAGGVYLVPAFTGLGAPYWDMYARGILCGITRGTKREHIVRGALESIAYQSKDIFEAMVGDSGIPLSELKVDGGACANNFLMQFQSDILGVAVNRPKNIETTALGAAFLAGLGHGVWKDKSEIKGIWKSERIFTPYLSEAERERKYLGWRKAVARSMRWEEE